MRYSGQGYRDTEGVLGPWVWRVKTILPFPVSPCMTQNLKDYQEIPITTVEKSFQNSFQNTWRELCVNQFAIMHFKNLVWSCCAKICFEEGGKEGITTSLFSFHSCLLRVALLSAPCPFFILQCPLASQACGLDACRDNGEVLLSALKCLIFILELLHCMFVSWERSPGTSLSKVDPAQSFFTEIMPFPLLTVV